LRIWESDELWKKRFGSYSQEFSKYVCDKLKGDALENMSFEQKKEYIEEKKIKLKQELELAESEEKDLQSKEKIKQKIEDDIESSYQKVYDLTSQAKKGTLKVIALSPSFDFFFSRD
ncbi:hypothetical protein LCGC14_2641920, partial [marine sediment metagenome]